MTSKTPLYDAVLNYAAKDPARFHMPGHKGGRGYDGGYLNAVLPYDLTELPGTDNLYTPEDVINEAEELAARVFDADFTLFSAGGATLCVQTMLFNAIKKGDSIIVCRNCHKSVVNALGLIDAKVIWVFPETGENNLLHGLKADNIETALRNNPDAKAVFITSPDYYGIMADVKGISDVCHKHNIPLLCDSAHGAHLHFLNPNLHPLAQGADICSDSAHKTLPVMTGGAYLNIKGTFFEKKNLKKAMSLFGSSSPSYPIMASLDKARLWCEASGKEAFEKLKNRCLYIKNELDSFGYITLRAINTDPVRITVNTASLNLNAFKAYEYLYKNGIYCEMADNENLVLIPSPFNSECDFDMFLKSMYDMSKLPRSDDVRAARELPKPFAVLSINEAIMSKTEKIKLKEAAGRICAEPLFMYPPAIPFYMPGERIDDISCLLCSGFSSDDFITVTK